MCDLASPATTSSKVLLNFLVSENIFLSKEFSGHGSIFIQMILGSVAVDIAPGRFLKRSSFLHLMILLMLIRRYLIVSSNVQVTP